MAAAAVKKAAGNPAASVFLAVLVGAVVLQGVKNIPEVLPDFLKYLWGKVPVLPDIDVTAPVDYTYKAIKITAALNEEVYEGIEQISAKNQDPFESFIFGDEDFNVYEPGEVGAIQTAYRGARDNLVRAAWTRGGRLN